MRELVDGLVQSAQSNGMELYGVHVYRRGEEPIERKLAMPGKRPDLIVTSGYGTSYHRQFAARCRKSTARSLRPRPAARSSA